MTRPESGLFLILLPVFTFLNARRPTSTGSRSNRFRSLAALTGPAILGGVPYLVFHIIYFGQILPNTYYAKYGGKGLHVLSFGISYLCASFGPYLAASFAVIAVLLTVARTDRLRIQAEIFAACVAFCLYIAYAGGDDIQAFPMGRLLIPVILLSYLLLASLIEDILRLPHRKALLAAGSLVLLVLMQEATEGATLIRWASNHPLAAQKSSVWSNLGTEFVAKLHSFGDDPQSPALRDQRTTAVSGPIASWLLAHTRPSDYVALGDTLATSQIVPSST